MFDHSTHPEVAEWFASFGVAEVPYSGSSIDLTNEPPEHWFYKRNKLRPESLKLDLRFLRHANFGARLLEPEALSCNSKIRQWLAPCADTFGWNRKMQPE